MVKRKKQTTNYATYNLMMWIRRTQQVMQGFEFSSSLLDQMLRLLDRLKKKVLFRISAQIKLNRKFLT